MTGNQMQHLIRYSGLFAALLTTVLVTAAVAAWQGPTTLVFAWTLNFMLMMSILAITETFKPRLTSSYYDPKPWEREGKIYKWLGINLYRKLLVWVGWEKLNKAANPVKKSPDALASLEHSTRKSEFGHLVIFLIVLGFTGYVAFFYGFRQSLWLLVLNVILNAYPIGLQRYNRPRLQRAIRVIKGTGKASEVK